MIFIFLPKNSCGSIFVYNKKKEPINMASFFFNIPARVLRSAQIYARQNIGSLQDGESWLPEDAELSDVEDISRIIDQAFDKKYAIFEPQIVSTFDKDYFLPALKVLRIPDEEYVSPSREARWKDMELRAECQGGHDHESPDPECDCGIYGSVNLDEIFEYIQAERQRVIFSCSSESIGYTINKFGEVDVVIEKGFRHELPKTFSLCIIEPSPDARVILCRKGWKASHAFISEVIEETISVSDANALLSIAWNRKIDIRRLYESR